MENQFPLRLIKEEQESSEKLLELLVSSTHSPKGRFSKENSYIILKRKMETTKNGNTVKLVLPFPHFLWMLGTKPVSTKEKAVLHEPQTEQENINRNNTNYEEDKRCRYAGCYCPSLESLCHASGTGS